jgi:glycosyltransferase involved in cell wall biosynthesis
MARLRPKLLVETLHPGTPISPVPPDEVAAARRELGASATDVLFGIFGRLQRWKAQDVFVEAAKLVAATEPRARFAVVGGAVFGLEPEYESLLRRLAGEAGLGSHMVFTGHRTDVARLMAACDVVCHATRVAEPFGMVIVEAMAQRRPVVATRGGGPSEIVVDGVTGLLVAPDDARAMAEAMARLAGDAVFRREVGEAGLRRASEKFSATAYAERLVRRLDTVAAGASVPSGL